MVVLEVVLSLWQRDLPVYRKSGGAAELPLCCALLQYSLQKFSVFVTTH
jgi:hypothetical protein